MITKTYTSTTIVLFISAMLLVGCHQDQTAAKDPNVGAGPTALPTAASASQLDDQTRDALIAALADERRAHATYEAVAAKFGDARPFSNIVNAEASSRIFLTPPLRKI